MSTSYRIAPPGFTIDQWERFQRDGFLLIEDALSPEECDRYCAAIDAIAAADPCYDPAKHLSVQNAVEQHPDLVDMIDRETHIGFAYDLYGELTKVHLSNVMLRPHKTWRNYWHPDGARGLPFQVFSPELPLQFKVGYWLTDLPEPDMGNLVVLPGSHRSQVLDAYDTHDDLPGQLPVCVKRGSLTLMHCGTWHKVNPNESKVVRKNVFMTYSPSWITPEDRYQNDPAWLATLNREQRILMRSYAHPYTNTKPPAEDFPLFLDRDSGQDRDPGVYRDSVELHRRKRRTFHEKLGATTRA